MRQAPSRRQRKSLRLTTQAFCFLEGPPCRSADVVMAATAPVPERCGFLVERLLLLYGQRCIERLGGLGSLVHPGHSPGAQRAHPVDPLGRCQTLEFGAVRALPVGRWLDRSSPSSPRAFLCRCDPQLLLQMRLTLRHAFLHPGRIESFPALLPCWPASRWGRLWLGDGDDAQASQ